MSRSSTRHIAILATAILHMAILICEPVVHQADPTLRVHIAGTGRALGVPHVDADYFHQVSSSSSSN